MAVIVLTKTDSHYEIATMTTRIGESYQSAVVSAAYASALLDYLRLQGLKPDALYAQHPLPSPAELTARGQLTLGEWMRMFEIAAEALGDADLALKAGAQINIRHMGVLGQVLMNCSHVAEAAAQLSRYIRLLGEFGQPQVEIHGAEAHLIWTWPYDCAPPVALVQFMQAARATLTRWLTSRPDIQGDAHFFFPAPADTGIYEKLFGGVLHFEAPVNKIVVAASYLQAPIVLGDESWRRRAEREARAILQRLDGEAELPQQLRKTLVGKLELGRACLDEAAHELGLHPRALQRRLEAEGTSFRRLLDEVRQARAEQYLRDPGLRLAEVAFLLGYSEQSAFQYAFKQWTGKTPGEYRANLQA